MKNEKLNLWVFWYCSCVYESSSFPMSYHRTKRGATDAMVRHREKARSSYERMNKGEELEKLGLKFGMHQSWSVDKFELEIFP